MKLRRTLLLLALLSGSSAVPAPLASAQEEGADPRLEQAARNRAVLQAALAKARAKNQRVLVIWTWKGDPEGERFRAWLGKQPALSRKLLYEYRQAHLESLPHEGSDEPGGGLDLNRLEEPTLTIFDAERRVVSNRGASRFRSEDGRSWNAGALVDWLTEHQAEPWNAGERLEKALGRARAADKLLLVTFGAPWCGWCHRLEDRLARAEVHERLDRDFDLLAIDVEREVEGRAVMQRYRGSEQGGLPWFVFLAEADEVVATSEGPDGNLGCPATPEELEAFGGILRRASRHMSEEDVAAVLKIFREQDAARD